ncbi:MAG: hypothetical protein M1569_02150 [Candidatus Marsarchaeota archaeon]|nr:hypothetical protein [Candidatus Marsarchaeota archaeon]MCL5413183.1 hypothetical protein [Candidatus Marsarchaeota archaeon]
METENSYDVRGRQSGIFRLYGFDNEGLVHMIFYRIAVFAALLLAAAIIIGFAFDGQPFTPYSKVLVLIVWILFTPQLFETGKAMSIIATRGIVFGRLNESFLKYGVKMKGMYKIYRSVPYIILMMWAAGFVGIWYLWFV